MANVHTVSNQEPTESISSNDLILISQALNSYGTQYKSKKATFRTAAASMEKLFRVDNFKNELSVLDEIFTEYVDGREVEFKYDKEKAQLILNTGSQPHSIDVNDFIASGMIEKVEYKKPNIIITFKLASGKTQEIKVDITDIQILSAGNGIIIDGKTIKIDTDVVATLKYADDISGYADEISAYADDISGYADDISAYADDISGYLTSFYTTSETSSSEQISAVILSSMQLNGASKTLSLIFNNKTTLTADLSPIQCKYNAGTGISLDINSNTFSISDSIAEKTDIHNGTLSIIYDGNLIQTFSANASEDISVEIPKSASQTIIRVWED